MAPFLDFFYGVNLFMVILVCIEQRTFNTESRIQDQGFLCSISKDKIMIQEQPDILYPELVRRLKM